MPSEQTRRSREDINEGAKLLSDVVGLSKVMPPLSRRGFMTSSAAAAAGYTLAAGPVRADVIRTDTNGLISGGAQVMVPGGNMPVYYARPANAQNPPIVLVAMEIFGLHEYIKDVTRRLGHLGAFAVASDFYFRKGVDLTKITEISNLLPIVNSKPDAELFSDLDATVAWAKSQGGDGDRLGIMGFCRGGRTVWLYSTHNPDLKAGVAFYGSLADAHSDAMPQNALDLASQVKEPVLGLYGADDRRQDGRVSHLSRRAARLSRRLSAKLPQRSGRGWLEPDDRLVQKIQSARLINQDTADCLKCPLLALSGHRLVRCTCLLLTQSGHRG